MEQTPMAGARAVARRSLSEIMAAPADLDRAKLDATTDEDIERYKAREGYGPEYRPAGSVLTVPAAGDLRAELGMTQEAFASFLRVPVGTVRNWEQGRTPPDPAARTLLALIAADPAHAVSVLGNPLEAVQEQQGRARRHA